MVYSSIWWRKAPLRQWGGGGGGSRAACCMGLGFGVLALEELEMKLLSLNPKAGVQGLWKEALGWPWCIAGLTALKAA